LIILVVKEIKAMPKKKTVEEFIYNSTMIHGNKYDYSKVIYVTNKKKVEIICKIHGSFFQTPNDHIGKHGCRKCSEECQLNYNLKEAYSKKNEDLPLDLYVLELDRNGDIFLKIGISKEVNKRIINIQTKSKAKVKKLLILPTTLKEATLIEDKVLKDLRSKYKKFHTKQFAGYSECFKIEAKNLVLNSIKEFLDEDKSTIVGEILDYEYGN
jgi:hypothetical protein